MKKIMLFFLVIILNSTASCQVSNKMMLEIYSNDENYITLNGEIIEINCMNDDIFLSIKSEELKQYIPNENNEYEYLVFSKQAINLYVGDTIVFITSKVQFKYINWLPIVSITKNNINILDFEDGKNNLINWVKQLQLK